MRPFFNNLSFLFKKKSKASTSAVSAEKFQSFLNESIQFESIVDHKDLTYTIWGDDVKQDVFERWSQG